MPDQIFMTLKTYFKSQVLYKVTTLGTWGLIYAVQQVSQRLRWSIESFEYGTKKLKYRIIYDQNEPVLGDYR